MMWWRPWHRFPAWPPPPTQTGCCDAGRGTFRAGRECSGHEPPRGNMPGPFWSTRARCAQLSRKVRRGAPLDRADMTYIAVNSSTTA